MKINWLITPTDYIWQNGNFTEWDKAQTHVLTHALHYGSGVFEGVRFYDTPKGTAILKLEEHTERLFYSASALKMKIPYSKEEINEATKELVRKNGIKSGYIRPLAFYGAGKMGLNPTGSSVDLIIACWSWGKYLSDALKVNISKYIRIHPRSTVCDAKICGHYINSILPSFEAQEAGCDEALLLDFEGNIAEGPGENFFMVKDGVVYTTPLGTILKGITRDMIFEIAKNEGIEIQEKTITPDEALKADELFFTGTAAEVSPIAELDGKQIADGKEGAITKILKQRFYNAVQGEDEKYAHWLTLVN